MSVKPPDEDLAGEAGRDPGAKAESADFSRLDEFETAKHRVKMAVQSTLAFTVPVSIILAFILFWIGVFIYVIQLVTPISWLTDDQLHELRTVLFSGVIGAVVSEGVKRYL